MVLCWRYTLKILDTSCRDGGNANNWLWPEPVFRQIVESLQPHVDIIEIGYRRPGKTGFEYCDDDYIDKVLGQKYDNLAIMIDYKDYKDDTNINFWMYHFKQKSESPITYVRIACDIKDLEEVSKLAELLNGVGYKVTINIMKASMLQSLDIATIHSFHKLGRFRALDYLYFADSFGSIYSGQIEKEFLGYGNLDVGYHPHNNLGIAFTHWKNKYFDIIDSSIGGLGRGAGNLDTIQVLLDRDKKLDYKLYKCLKYIEKVKKKAQCGYCYEYHYCAINNIHPNYAVYLKGLRDFGRYDIIKILSRISENKRNSFDKEYIEELVNIGSWWK
jgi:4-hydroxy 2-oxovalerate aldolase